MKKILIFHSKAGGGHLRCAEALALELKSLNPKLKISLVDCLEQTDLGYKLDPAQGWITLSTKLIYLFNLLYLLTNNSIGVNILRKLIKFTWGETFSKIILKENPDLIITTHHFISPLTIKGHISKPFITVVTDLGYPHRIWFDPLQKEIIIPTSKMLSYVKKIIGPSSHTKILSLGYPLKPEFRRLKANHSLSQTILVLGGGSGSGKLKQTVITLLKHLPKFKIVVVTGHNKNLNLSLSKIHNPKLKVLGFVNYMPKLIKQADIVITKAGPASIMEAAVMGKPIIITDWIGLQEKYNVSFVIDYNLGLYEPQQKNIPNAIAMIYKDYKNFSQKQNKLSHGSQEIAQHLLKVL